MPRYQQPERTSPAYPFPPGSWGVRGTDNLRQYLSEAALPTMTLGPTAPQIPPSGHKSHMNLLSTRLERDRHLTSMFSFDAGDLASSVRKFTNAQVPDQTLAAEDEDPYTLERLSVPCQGFEIPRATLLAPDNLDRFVSWCDHLPLQTIQRVMHLVHPSSNSWRISPEGGDVDDSILRCFTWTRPPPKTGADGDPGQTSAIIIVQPPWILAEQDLKSFGKCQSFPNYKEDWVCPMKSSERLWGKVYDVCVARDCPWFVLTNYSGWVFGVFSKGWTRGFATPVQAFNSSDSGILEYLFYWFSSSMELPGSFVIPEVPTPCLTSSEPDDTSSYVSIHPSESHWDGKSEKTPSSAGLSARSISLPVSRDSLTALPASFTVRRTRDSHNTIDHWRKSRMEELPSITEDIASQASTTWSTVRGSEATALSNGDWLVS